MLKYTVWLHLCMGAGNKRSIEAINHYKNAKNIFECNNRESSKIFTKKELERMKNIPLGDAIRVIADCKENGIDIICYGDEKYPYCLSVIEDAPLVLFVKGELPNFDSTPSICIVGPRKVSEFGRKAAYSLAFRLAGAGFTIVSGGAIGCDTYAHAGALKAEGKTVLVMGCGILSDYLPENKELRENVIKKGCLISEYPPRESASRFTFPVRNRIMSALSLGTVVVEAGEKSGALITARHSYEQGRDVFVIPAAPNRREYAGSNALLRDGAKPLLDVSDIFNEYILRFPDKINIENAYKKPIITPKAPEKTKNNEKIIKKVNISLSKEAEIVYNYLDKQIFLPEEILNTGLTPQQLLSALTELEMEFLIEAMPGGRYKLLQ